MSLYEGTAKQADAFFEYLAKLVDVTVEEILVGPLSPYPADENNPVAQLWGNLFRRINPELF